MYDIDLAAESGLQFKKKVEELTRISLSFSLKLDIPVTRQNIICNQLWRGYLSDSFMFNPSTIPDYCSFVLIASPIDAVANVASTSPLFFLSIDFAFHL